MTTGGVTTARIRLALEGQGQVVRGMQEVQAGIGGMRSAMASIAGGLSLGAAVGQLVQVQREMDVLNASMVTVTGSSRAASTEMEWIKRFAARTPYQLNEVTGAFVKMKALGLDASEKALRSYADTASGMGKDLNQFIEAVADAATGEFERLRDFGIKSKREGDKVSLTFRGTTTTIKNSSAEIVSYLQNIGNTDFAGASVRRMDTLDGAISNLADSWDELARTVNEAGVGNLIETSVRGATAAISGLGATIRENKTELAVLAGGLGGAALVATLPKVGAGLMIVAGGVKALGLALAANPLTLALLGIGAVVGGVTAYDSAYRKTAEGMRKTIEQMEEANRLAAQNLSGRNLRPEIVRDVNAAIAERTVKINELKDRLADMAKTARDAFALTDPRRLGAVTDENNGMTPASSSGEEALQALRFKYLEDARTDAQKLKDELENARKAFGGVVPPEVEAAIRESFVKPGQAAVSEFDRLKDQLTGSVADGYAQAQAAAQGLSGAQADFLKLANSPDWAKLTDSQRQQVAALFETRIAHEQAGQSARDLAAANEQAARAYANSLKPFEDAAASAQSRVADMQAENQALALSESLNISLARAVEMTAIARLKEAQALEMAKGAGMDDARVLAIQAEIDARQKLVDLMGGREVKEASKALRDREAQEWARTWDQVGQSFTDALMEGGKSVSQYLKGLFRTLVLRPILAPVGAAMASLLGGPASAAQGGAGGLGGGVFDIGRSFDVVKGVFADPSKIFSSFSDSLAFAADSAGQWLVQNTTGVLNRLGGSLMGNAGTIGTVGAYAGGAMAGIGIGRGISGGYSAIGKSGNTAVNAGTIIGSIFGGPIGGAIGGAIGGLVNRVFGRKLADSGFTGSYGPDGFTGQSFEYYEGGLLRSDKTTYGDLDPTIARTLTDQFAAMNARTLTAMRALGVTGISDFTGSLSLSTQGLSPEQASQRLAEEFAKLADAQAMFVLGNDAYVRSGETASVTLQRLSTSLTGVNQVLDTLGLRAYAVSLASGDMASSLADLFGGLDAFAQASTTYYQAFYTQGERTATTTRKLTEALGQLGLALPETRQAYRALVEAQDLTTEAGRNAYAALVQLAPTFAELAPSVDDLAASAANLQQALQQAGDSVAEEIKRLRGLNTTASADQGLAALQARFATATASARAGSTSALAELPAISQALEEAAALQARTAAELALLRNQTAASLALTMAGLGLQVPAFDVGTNYVPRDMFARIHEGEAIVPKAYNPAAAGGGLGNGDTVTELRAIRQRLEAVSNHLEQLELGVVAVAGHTAKTSRILERAQPTGDALLTMTMAEFDTL